MKSQSDIFVQLQKHLDTQAVGYPSTKKGVEIQLLKKIFKPEQANMALYLTYKFENIPDIEKRIQKKGQMTISKEELEKRLDQMTLDRAIMRRIHNNEKQYAIVPLVVGMYELQLGHLDKEFVELFDQYTKDPMWGLSFIGTEYSQMRTIPIEQSITPEHKIANYNELKSIIMNSSGPFVINKCICREKTAIIGKACLATKRTELCLAIGDMAQICIDGKIGREISKDEALEISRQNEEEGLVLQPSGEQEAQFICACCGCCCGMLHLHQRLPHVTDFWTSDYYSVVDPSLCKGCGVCIKRCHINAIKLLEVEPNSNRKVASIDSTKCIGCGVCIAKCSNKAIKLIQKDNTRVIPKTHDEFYDEIKKKKRTKWQLLKMGINLKRGKRWH